MKLAFIQLPDHAFILVCTTGTSAGLPCRVIARVIWTSRLCIMKLTQVEMVSQFNNSQNQRNERADEDSYKTN